jgi:hypothetical protein
MVGSIKGYDEALSLLLPFSHHATAINTNDQSGSTVATKFGDQGDGELY